ncbi:MAG: aldehyde ferredoxin oxidoreductase family protein [Candidatus Hodarchaeales archaeon]|jgi:aldehyde:ferredoxin oxidoreductase
MNEPAMKVLHVNLRRLKYRTEELEPELSKKYLGGIGLATKLLFDMVPKGIEPLSPENALIFATGPFAGTAVPTSGKYAVAAKSPLTGLMGYGISSGRFSSTIKYAGYDAITITGRSRGLLYLFIDDEKVQFRNATHLKGKTTSDTEELIKEDHGDPNIQVASIGPAGENFVKFACITNEKTRQVGRTGLGAIMGSKNVKAIAIRGTCPVEIVANKKRASEFLELVHKLTHRCQTDATLKYRNYGTPANVMGLNEVGALPTRNFQDSVFENAENISGERLKAEFLTKVNACYACAIGCDHVVQVRGGPHKGALTGLDYETIFALGSCCGVDDLPAVIKAAQRCDELGMDTISTGVTIAFAMECYGKGLLTDQDTDGLKLEFGNAKAMLKVVELIAKKEGIGSLLAEGSRIAAEKIGRGTIDFAMQVKGLELPGYSLRSLNTAALGFSVSTRGGCHLRNAGYSLDLSGKMDRFKGDARRGPVVKANEDLYSVYDSLILCKFVRKAITEEEIARLFTLVTGIPLTVTEMLQAGERITNLQKMFNLREGTSRKEDYPPPRAFKESLADNGPAHGRKLNLDQYNIMLDSYYKARGWTLEGKPTPEKLEELDLDQLVGEFQVEG